MSDHAAALALAGHLDQALESAAWVDLPAIRASGLSQIAAAMAVAGDEQRAQEIAEEALQVLGEDRRTAGHMNTEIRDTGNETHWWLDPGDQELKEGSWLLSRAVRALPPAGGNRKLPDSVASAVATAGTAESAWMRSLGLDEILKLILTGQTDAAVAKLTKLRAKAASNSDDFQRTRSMRWAAELFIRLGETTTALAIARDISAWNESGNSSSTAGIREWVADTLRRLSEALSAAADDAAATEAAEAAMRAAERIEDEAVRQLAEVRVIRTYAAIGQYDRALARWHDDLAIARASGRAPLFDLIGAEASALAAHGQGLTLWNIYEAVSEVETWWGTLQLA
jgi:tetratricopeptide (TPR) repeat protein